MNEELLQYALDGDKSAESKLFALLTVRFRYLAKRYIADEDAEDVAQDACITILEKYKEQEFTQGFEPWAHGVLKKKIGNYFQKKATIRKNIVATDIEKKANQFAADESTPGLKVRLVECLKKINKAHPRYARVLNLIHLGYSTDEICSMLKVKPNYLYVLLNRGRMMLRSCLELNEVNNE